jgi:predicted DNA-binding protein with PD1-like motif
MKYQEGGVGRLFLLRFDDEDSVIEEIEGLAVREGLERGWVWLLGALKDADMVVGPKSPVIPPEPVFESFGDGREVVAVGSIFPDDEAAPRLHIHGAVGKGKATLAGCIRRGEVYLVAEALVMELTGLSAQRLQDPASGMKLLAIP